MRAKLTLTVLFATVVASQLGNTDCGQVLRDSSFDLWCGDHLCAWKVERGDAVRVPTWNPGDPGVELVGSDAAIEQLAPVDSGDGTCIEFTMLANVDPQADVELNIDVFGDGTIEHSERIPAVPWKAITYQLLFASPYAGVRFEIAKKGAGKAQLAKIGAKMVTGCEGLTPIDEGLHPLGTPCTNSPECASGLCSTEPFEPPWSLWFTGVCVGCDDTHACSNGTVCGSYDPVGPVNAVPVTCVAPASRQLGETCAGDDECTTGACGPDHVCSTCNYTHPCGGGESCGPAWRTNTGYHSAWTCSPRGHRRTSGEACATNDDCASSVCNGTPRKQCDDGRACETAASCPFGNGNGEAGNLQNGPCNEVDGVEGGSCQ